MGLAQRSAASEGLSLLERLKQVMEIRTAADPPAEPFRKCAIVANNPLLLQRHTGKISMHMTLSFELTGSLDKAIMKLWVGELMCILRDTTMPENLVSIAFLWEMELKCCAHIGHGTKTIATYQCW